MRPQTRRRADGRTGGRAALAFAFTFLSASATAGAQEFPKTPPAPAPVRPAPFPPFQEATLPNGLRLLVVENRSAPIASPSSSKAVKSWAAV